MVQRNIIDVLRPILLVYDQVSTIMRGIVHQKVLGTRVFKQERLFTDISALSAGAHISVDISTTINNRTMLQLLKHIAWE